MSELDRLCSLVAAAFMVWLFIILPLMLIDAIKNRARDDDE